MRLPGVTGTIDNPPGLKPGLTTLPGIITTLLPIIFTIAGLILFAMLIWGGFELLLSGGDKHAAESARGRITMAFIGFILVFAAFWLTRFLLAFFHLE